MLRKLLIWASDAASETSAAKRQREEDRRRERRQDLSRASLTIRDGRIQSVFHLKDMSCQGASGISDIPLAVGSVILVQLRKGRYKAAQVRWVHNALTGLRFIRPLEPELLHRLERSRRGRARNR